MKSLATSVLVAVAVLLCWCVPAQAESTLEGTVVVEHSDDFAGKESTVRRMLVSGQRRLRLVPRRSSRLSRIAPGTRVRVRGKRKGKTVTVSRVKKLTTASAATQAQSVRKVAVLRVRFNSGEPSGLTESAIRSSIFGTVNDFLGEQTGGQLRLTGHENPAGDIFGWYQIEKNRPGNNSACDHHYWRQQARDRFHAQGKSVANYNHIVIVFPSQSCGWGGSAELGGPPTVAKYSWLNGSAGTYIAAHELGHNLGLHHANSLSCSSGSRRVAVNKSCMASVGNEYGDPFDTMGGGLRHYNGWHKGRLNFFGHGPAVSTQTVTGSGTFTLNPTVVGAPSPQALRVPIDSGNYYFLEIRRPSGIYDQSLGLAAEGVSIRLAKDYDSVTYHQTRLLDATPDTTSFSDSSLRPGGTFSDPEHGITLRTLSVSSDRVATVQVQRSGSTPDPSPTPPPPTGSGSAPLVTIHSPRDGATLSKRTKIEASATDDKKVKRLEIFVDGKLLAGKNQPQMARPWSVGLPRWSPGPHTITAKAFDFDGNTGSASVTVTKID